MSKFEIFCGNAADVLKTLPEKSVDCCVTSPPYYQLRDYEAEGQIGLEKTVDEYIRNLVTAFHELKRVMKDEGTLWIIIGDSYAGSGKGRKKDGKYSDSKGIQSFGQVKDKLSKTITGDDCKQKDLIGIPWLLAFALRSDGWYLRQDIIWEKPNAMPESVKDRCTSCYEHVFLFSKSPKYYFNCEAIKEDCINGDPYSPRGSKGTKSLNKGLRVKEKEDRLRLKKRNKRNIWKINTHPNEEAHYATFPEKLVETCLLAGCPEGGKVIDIFSGSGTTGVVALKQGKEYIGIDINKYYCDIQLERLTPIVNQISIFDLLKEAS